MAFMSEASLRLYDAKLKQYISTHGGSGGKQVDLSSSTNTSFALNANTLYILPDVSSEVSITLTQPETGVAKVWEFVVKVINGSIAFPDSIDINPAFSFTSHTKYYVRVINNALTATAVGDPGTIYLYNANGYDPLC